MRHDERCSLRGRILRADHIETARLQIADHVEDELSHRRVVHHVPGTEEQPVLPVTELRNTEAHTATAIVAEVVGEVVIQVVRLRTVVVDHELQIVSNTVARGVDTTLVVEFCHEIRRGVHLITVGKGLRVQITVDGGTYRVVLDHLTAVEHETVVLTMQGDGLLVVDGIETHQAVAIRIADILGYGEGKAELAAHDAVRALIERLRTILVDERRLGTVSTVVVQLTGDGLLRIPHGSRQHAIETRSQRLLPLDMSIDTYHTASTELLNLCSLLVLRTT